MARVLLTNDDGYFSPGIRRMIDVLSQFTDLVVVCPEQQRSAAGLSVTLHKPLRIRVANYRNQTCYLVNGTTGDCVSLGLFHILEKPPDMVVSGINIGENISLVEFFMSGTVAGALLAAIHNIPSISFSKSVESADVIGGRVRSGGFEEAARIAGEIVKYVLDEGLPEGVDMFNVNFPKKITRETRIVVTRLARLSLVTKVYVRHDPRGREYYWIWGEKFKNFPRGTDGYEVFINGNISLTPVSLSSLSTTPDLKKVQRVADAVNEILESYFRS